MPDYIVIQQVSLNEGYVGVKGPNANTSFTAADGDDACAAAAVITGRDGKYVAFDVTAAVPRNVDVVTAGQTSVTTL